MRRSHNRLNVRLLYFIFFFFSSRRRHTRLQGDWSSDVCSSDLDGKLVVTVRNEYGQSFRPKSIPWAYSHPYLMDTVGTYVDARGNTVNNGDYITPPATTGTCQVGGCLVGVNSQPNLKPDHIADVPYSSFGKPVYDAQ